MSAAAPELDGQAETLVAADGYRTGDLIRELAASGIFHGRVEATFRK